MTREKDIMYETDEQDFWVLKVPTGKTKNTFEVYENGITCSTRVARIGYKGDKGLSRAIAEAKRRQSLVGKTVIRSINPKAFLGL